MYRSFHRALATTAALVALAGPALGETSIKISVDPDDPEVHAGAAQDQDYVEFYLWIDGMDTRGLEIGLTIRGGEFLAYVIDTSKMWLATPLVDPYPGTISQVVAGPQCYTPPCYFGRVLVRPDGSGEPIVVDVIPTEIEQVAMVMDCFNEPTVGLHAYPAAINAEAPPKYRVHDRTELREAEEDDSSE